MDRDVRLPKYPLDSPASRHVALERLVALLLDEGRLEPWEHAHLTRCNECAHAMIDATRARLRSPGNSVQ